ncbi:hypothetical protein Taro_016619 [Colocasia esculenta]|uniref:Bulb-type lectin domain-containing protein n=1 Tax=Colocasia esculenta TaxID=4460 RepID=A0A843UKU6_COLES|nr:hypothetical protein [Colocasia esculenta]
MTIYKRGTHEYYTSIPTLQSEVRRSNTGLKQAYRGEKREAMARSSLHAWATLALLGLLLSTGALAEDILFNGETLNTGEFLESGPYRFIMQTDCNLVLYVNRTRALWASGTNGRGSNCRATLQNNGNLVVVSGSDIIWSSNSSRGSNSYRLIVQSDGNVVIYGGALWATNTREAMARSSLREWATLALLGLLLATGAVAEDILFNGETLNAGEFLENGPYRFIMQTDCNLVLYVNRTRALWASGTNGRGSNCRATLQNNGNLVVVSGSDIIWSSNRPRGSNSYRLIVQSDGNVVIYGGALWATNTVQNRKRRL